MGAGDPGGKYEEGNVQPLKQGRSMEHFADHLTSFTAKKMAPHRRRARDADVDNDGKMQAFWRIPWCQVVPFTAEIDLFSVYRIGEKLSMRGSG